jgi:hypothetical protein
MCVLGSINQLVDDAMAVVERENPMTPTEGAGHADIENLCARKP